MCAHFPDDVRTRGQEYPGAGALALSALRLTALAKTQGGASQRPSVLAAPMFVCCCIGQAKVNGATIFTRVFEHLPRQHAPQSTCRTGLGAKHHLRAMSGRHPRSITGNIKM